MDKDTPLERPGPKTALADRGSEFADVPRMERSSQRRRKRCSIWFCDPQQSQQKGSAENHVELRRILPKGRTDFDALTCVDMACCMSHVNSYCRKSIDWFAPIDMAKAVHPADLLDGLGVEKVKPGDINLTPSLVPHAVAK